jgi:hypothetical protein
VGGKWITMGGERVERESREGARASRLGLSSMKSDVYYLSLVSCNISVFRKAMSSTSKIPCTDRNRGEPGSESWGIACEHSVCRRRSNA